MNNMNRTGKSLFAPTITAFLAFAISFTIFACSSGGDGDSDNGEKNGGGNGACKATYNGTIVMCGSAPNITVNQKLCEEILEDESAESIEFISECPSNPDLKCTDTFSVGKTDVDVYITTEALKDIATCEMFDMESR